MAHIYFAPSTFRMVKNYFFEVTQNKFYKLIWLLKFNMPSNETKNEKAGHNKGLKYTPISGSDIPFLVKKRTDSV